MIVTILFINNIFITVATGALLLELVGIQGLWLLLSHGITYPWLMVACGVIVIALDTWLYVKRCRFTFIIFIIQLLIMVFLAPPFTTWYKHYNHGLYPNLKDITSLEAGPFVLPGTFHDQHLDMNGSAYTIWWKSSEPMLAKRFRYRARGVPEWHYPRVTCNKSQRCSVKLKGLKPGMSYVYQVHALTSDNYTLHVPRNHEKTHLVFTGDSGSTSKNDDYYSLQGLVNRSIGRYYNKRHVTPLRIHGGDLVRYGDDSRAWKSFFAHEGLSSSVPTIYIPGNHEYLGDRCSNFLYFFDQPRYFSAEHENLLIISLFPFDGYTGSADGPDLVLGHEQITFLEQKLRTSDHIWKGIVIHHPILSTGDYGINRLLYSQLVPIIRKYHVDLVLSGHDHHFEAFQMEPDAKDGGTFFIVSGTGGSKLDSYIMTRRNNRWKNWFQHRDSAYGLYSPDPLVKKWHLYGELSWGFTQIQANDGQLSISYHRIISLPEYLDITGQNIRKWRMVPFSEMNITAKKVFSVTKQKTR